MTKEEWYKWAKPRIEVFMDESPGETPSVDRKDTKGHYEPSNLQIINWHQNLTQCSFFTQKLGVGKKSTRQDKLEALKKIIQGQCKTLGLNYKKALEDVSNC